MRYRKTIKIAPGIKLNVSKKGISTTIGPKGFSINKGSSGTYLNTGIPGSGLFSRRKLSTTSGTNSLAGQSSVLNMMFSDADLWAKKKSKYSFIVLIMIAGIISLFFQIFVSITLLLTGLILLIWWMTSDAGKSTSLIRKARKVFSQNDNIKTMEYLEKADSLYSNPFLKGHIIRLAINNQRPEVALNYLNQTENKNPAILFDKAECNFEVGNFTEAAKNYELVLQSPESADHKDYLLSNYGISLFNTGDYKRAIEVLQKISTSYENQSLLTLLIGQSFFKIGDAETAILSFTDYLGHKRNFDSNMIEMCYTLGQAYLKSGDPIKAKFWFNKVYIHDINYKDTAILLNSLPSK
jgi:tetratricopeptide (TPR) repeat protein